MLGRGRDGRLSELLFFICELWIERIRTAFVICVCMIFIEPFWRLGASMWGYFML